MIEDNPRVPKPDPAIPGVVSDEDLNQQGTVRIIGGDTPARKARMIAHGLPASRTQPVGVEPLPNLHCDPGHWADLAASGDIVQHT